MAQIQIPLSSIKLSGDSEASARALNPKSAGKKVGVTTMGCKVNAYESELISETLKTDNWQVVSSKEEADLYIINTCTVTKEADRQARQEVRKVIRRNSEALVVVTGCYAQMDADACADIPGVDLVLGNDRKLDVHQLLPKLENGELPKVLVGDLDQHVSLPEHLLTGYEAQTRAFVQIQQGCNQGCTFCIIHKARGPSRSLAPTLVRRQVQRLVMNGYPEIVICGVDLGSYGDDLPQVGAKNYNLVQLIKDLLTLETIDGNPFRVRLSSIDPYHITDELIELMAREPRLCPHIHLSLQSGSTLILKRMKRRYDEQFVRDRISKLRQKVPELVMSADVMVGFPTETEEDYQGTENVVRELEIAYPHIFTYSERPGTPAARIPEAKQVPISERKDRAARLRNVAAQLQKELLARREGNSAWVLPEKAAKKEGYFVARSEDYLSVLVKAEQLELAKWKKVQYKETDNTFLVGHPVD